MIERNGMTITDFTLKTLAAFAKILLWTVLLVTTWWASIAIYYSSLPDPINVAAGLLFGLGSLLILILVRPWRRAVDVALSGSSTRSSPLLSRSIPPAPLKL